MRNRALVAISQRGQVLVLTCLVVGRNANLVIKA